MALWVVATVFEGGGTIWIWESKRPNFESLGQPFACYVTPVELVQVSNPLFPHLSYGGYNMQDILPSCPEVAYVKHIYFTNIFTNIFHLSHQNINPRTVVTLQLSPMAKV